MDDNHVFAALYVVVPSSERDAAIALARQDPLRPPIIFDTSVGDGFNSCRISGKEVSHVIEIDHDTAFDHCTGTFFCC